MKRRSRTAAALILAGMQILFAICGPLLHALPERSAKVVSRAEAAVAEPAAETALEANHDCPVCHYLAQTQLHVPAVRRLPIPPRPRRAESASTIAVVRFSPAAIDARGPPTASLV